MKAKSDIQIVFYVYGNNSVNRKIKDNRYLEDIKKSIENLLHHCSVITIYFQILTYKGMVSLLKENSLQIPRIRLSKNLDDGVRME